MQEVLDEGGQDHGEQDGVLGERHGQQVQTYRVFLRVARLSQTQAEGPFWAERGWEQNRVALRKRRAKRGPTSNPNTSCTDAPRVMML